MSAYGNFKRLTNVDKIEGQLDCLNGLKFLSMGWVVLGHLFIDIFGFTGLKKKIKKVQNLVFLNVKN